MTCPRTQVFFVETGVLATLRRLFQVVFVLGSVAGMASCGATDEGSPNPNGSSTASTPSGANDDGGATSDGGVAGSGPGVARGRTLLVQGGDVTIIGFDHRRRRCQGDDGGAQCTGQERFSGAVVIRGARLSILPAPEDGDGGVATSPGGDDDGGVTGAAGGADGGTGIGDGGVAPLPRNAWVGVEGAVLSFAPGSEDGGVGVPPDADGGISGSVGSAELQGGRILVIFGRDVGGADAGTGPEDGGLDRDRGGRREERRVRAVIIQGAVIHLGGRDGDAGSP